MPKRPFAANNTERCEVGFPDSWLAMSRDNTTKDVNNQIHSANLLAFFNRSRECADGRVNDSKIPRGGTLLLRGNER